MIRRIIAMMVISIRLDKIYRPKENIVQGWMTEVTFLLLLFDLRWKRQISEGFSSLNVIMIRMSLFFRWNQPIASVFFRQQNAFNCPFSPTMSLDHRTALFNVFIVRSSIKTIDDDRIALSLSTTLIDENEMWKVRKKERIECLSLDLSICDVSIDFHHSC